MKRTNAAADTRGASKLASSARCAIDFTRHSPAVGLSTLLSPGPALDARLSMNKRTVETPAVIISVSTPPHSSEHYEKWFFRRAGSDTYFLPRRS